MTIEEEDIMHFVTLSDAMKRMKEPTLYPTYGMKEIGDRTNIYLEFLAAAFLKETGLKASEVELVMQSSMDEVRWFYRKKR
jgi:hypothetical protein